MVLWLPVGTGCVIVPMFPAVSSLDGVGTLGVGVGIVIVFASLGPVVVGRTSMTGDTAGIASFTGPKIELESPNITPTIGPRTGAGVVVVIGSS